MSDDISTLLQANENSIKEIFKNSSDIVYNNFQSYSGTNAILVYIDGVVKKEVLNRDVITPFISNYKNYNVKKCIYVSGVIETKSISEAVDKILEFNAILFVEKMDTAYIIDCKEWQKRQIEEPSSEIAIRGPKEGFVESIRINTTLLRRKIKNPNLIFENLYIGKQTKTNVVICYLDGITNQEILNEVRERVKRINIDGIFESGYIEQYIEDNHLTLFSTIGNSEKPDVIAAKLLEGRCAILCDGTPHALIIPHLFIEEFQSSEDYYQRPYISSILRLFRILSFLISTLLPSIYVALQTFHQEMIPTQLLIRMAANRESIPFPAAAEATFMIIMFELLRESSTRLPRKMGSAISIVGALIIGEAAVNAGLVSSAMVIVISITAITSFINSPLLEVIIIYRFAFLFLGSYMGLYGIICGIFLIVLHMTDLKSFGVPYMYPLTPFDKDGMKDYVIRFPLWLMKMRPKFSRLSNLTRRGKDG